jgi:hypothetical protein
MRYQQPYGAVADAPFVNGNPATGVNGSIPPAASIEHHQRELVHLIKWALGTDADNGIALGAPSENDLQQVRKAIERIIKNSTRYRLTGDVTVWVRQDGDDSNDGSQNDSAHAFATLQGAWNTIKWLYDPNGFKITLRLGQVGTYPGFRCEAFAGPVEVRGDENNRNAYVIGPASGQSWNIINSTPALTVRGVLMDNTGGGLTYWGDAGSGAILSDITWRSPPGSHTGVTHVYSPSGAYVLLVRTHSVISSGGASTIGEFIRTELNGIVDGGLFAIPTIMDHSNIAYNNAFVATYAGAIARFLTGAISFTGSATGKRYSATFGSNIDVAGAGATFLPGNASGTTATGGQYA